LKLGHVTQDSPIKGSFYGPYAGGVCPLCPYQFEADISSILSTVIRGSQNFEIGSRDPDHADLGVVLWSARRRGPSSISVPNLERTAQFVQKMLRGSQNLEIRSRDPGHAHLGVVLYSVRRRVCPQRIRDFLLMRYINLRLLTYLLTYSMSVPNLKLIALFVRNL